MEWAGYAVLFATIARRSGISGRCTLAAIRVLSGESLESAIRRFKRQVQQDGIIKEAKKHTSFLKPGERKRIKSQLAQRAKRKKVSRKLDIDPKALPRTGVDHKLL
jgi:small subunit ribosomal protein S21